MKKIKVLTLSLIVICLCLFLMYEKRSFYYNSDKTKCITVWKKFGGKCVVVPKKYIGLGNPDTEYFETTNRNSLTIIWEKNGKFDIIILNNYGYKLDLHFKNTKVKYYQSNNRKGFNKSYYLGNKIKPQCEYLMIDIGENWAILNGKKI